ncbi:MAG: alpha/beta hydrolase [Hyphomonadaceae bacterium]|nr:alpha/beta hydrolase [Hyphomonadaceae bacterium]
MSSESAPFRRVSYELKAGRMAGLAWGDVTRPPDILFLHATGFNARTYTDLLAPLGERFHVLAVDLRGHGLTQLPAHTFGYGSWNRHRDDVVELIEGHIRAPVTMAGHSMGATVSLLAAGKRPDLARGVAMIDPVLMSPAMYGFAQLPAAPLWWSVSFPIARGAARRRNTFATKEEALGALTGRGVFKAFKPEQLAHYVEDGFRETADGVRLSCTPAYEARTFSAQRIDPWRALARAPGPIVCLRAEKRSTMPQAAAERFMEIRPDGRLATVDGAGHMIPMERPDRTRAALETAALMANPQVYRDLV